MSRLDGHRLAVIGVGNVGCPAAKEKMDQLQQKLEEL